MVDFLTTLFFHVCHQNPARSFDFLVFGGKSILCARCTGMYLGLLTGAISTGFTRKLNNNLIITLLFFSLIFLIVEILLEKIIELPFGNLARFTTGIVFGTSVGIGIIVSIKEKIGGVK